MTKTPKLFCWNSANTVFWLVGGTYARVRVLDYVRVLVRAALKNDFIYRHGDNYWQWYYWMAICRYVYHAVTLPLLILSNAWDPKSFDHRPKFILWYILYLDQIIFILPVDSLPLKCRHRRKIISTGKNIR